MVFAKIMTFKIRSKFDWEFHLVVLYYALVPSEFEQEIIASLFVLTEEVLGFEHGVHGLRIHLVH